MKALQSAAVNSRLINWLKSLKKLNNDLSRLTIKGAEMIHYGLTEKETQTRYKSTGSFKGAKSGLTHLCGNGSYHADNTRDKNKVTCPVCRNNFLKGI